MAEYKSRHTGAEIDAGIDKAVAALPKTGGTMTGELILSGDPASEKAAATRQYVDRSIQNIELTPGEPGATYRPSISAEGVLTWTNDAGLPNPPQTAVRGPKGDDGFSPTISVAEVDGGHCLTVTDANGVQSFNVLDGVAGTGGVSWNDLTDKPFGEETRTKILDTVIIPEAQQGMAYHTNPLSAVPLAGEKYRVRWINDYYECTGQDVSAYLGQPAIALGNIGALTGGSDSGEPFVIALAPDGMDGEAVYAQVMCLNPDLYGVHIVVAVEMVEVSRIPDEYLPPVSLLNVNVAGEPGGDTSGWTADKPWIEVALAAMSGSMVFFRIANPDSTNFLMLLPMYGIDMDLGVIAFGGPQASNGNQIYYFASDGTFISYSD